MRRDPRDGIALLPSEDGSLPDHENLLISESSLSDIGDGGIVAPVPVAFEHLEIMDNVVDGADHRGISVEGRSSTVSHDLVMRGNVACDFARAAYTFEARGISLGGQIQGLDVCDNLIEDVDNQASYGIALEVWPVPGDLSCLCHNAFAGTLDTDERYYVAGQLAAWQADPDGDASVNACDCRDNDASVYPGAEEVNDAKDNECPGDIGYGAVDEISGPVAFLGHDRFAWTPQPGATLYQVARGEPRLVRGSLPRLDDHRIERDRHDRARSGRDVPLPRAAARPPRRLLGTRLHRRRVRRSVPALERG